MRPSTRNEGEINLVRSGLSETLIIARGEMMIALMWEGFLSAVTAHSCTHTLSHIPTSKHRQSVFRLRSYKRANKFYQTASREHIKRKKQFNAFAPSIQISECRPNVFFEKEDFLFYSPFHRCCLWAKISHIKGAIQ